MSPSRRLTARSWTGPAPRSSRRPSSPTSSCAGCTAARPRPSPGPCRSAGDCAEMRPPPPHRATTAHLRAAYPFLAEGGLGARGVYIGRDLFGGSFCHDPWELYGRGVVTGPNAVVLGQIGRGKSSFIKSYLWRSQVFGRQAWVIDPKGEYAVLAAACGTSPLRIGPGHGVRLNPLDPGPGAGQVAPGELVRRQAELLCSLAAASMGRPLAPGERTAA